MSSTGVTLSLDLPACKSPALDNEGLLEQVLVSALQFAGLEVTEQVAYRLSGQGVLVLCVLRQGYAALHAQTGTGAVIADVTIVGQLETARAALEIVRGFLAQKLIARAVNARVSERGDSRMA